MSKSQGLASRFPIRCPNCGADVGKEPRVNLADLPQGKTPMTSKSHTR